LTTIRIEDVLQSDGILKKGDTTVLIEYFQKITDLENKNIVHIWSAGGCSPLKMNQKYLLFLNTPTPKFGGNYAVAGGWQGRFPLTEKTIAAKFSNLTPEDMEFPPDETDKYLWLIASEAFDKYIK
jgi:hypothetical protein